MDTFFGARQLQLKKDDSSFNKYKMRDGLNGMILGRSNQIF